MYLARRSLTADLYQIWATSLSHGRNQLCKVFSYRGNQLRVWILWGGGGRILTIPIGIRRRRLHCWN